MAQRLLERWFTEEQPMATIIKRLVSQDGIADRIQALAAAAREALEPLDDEDLTVSFSTWDDGGTPRFVCRVETPPGDPSSSAPPWRWWSPLFSTPDELRAALAILVASRGGRREETDATGAESAAAS
jgi:hypothetical protein